MFRRRFRIALCAALLGACSGEELAPVGESGVHGFGITVPRLPEFRVYDRSGALVLHEFGFEEGAFAAALAAALNAPQPIPGAASLASVSAELTAVSGCGEVGAFELGPHEAVDFVFVEYWAQWCGPCQQQLAYVHRFLEERGSSDIAWVKVERRSSREQRAVRVR